MKKIYMHEKDMPKVCGDCFACFKHLRLHWCSALYCQLGFDISVQKSDYCPLRSIEHHDKEHKKKVLADLVTAIKEQGEKNEQ